MNTATTVRARARLASGCAFLLAACAMRPHALPMDDNLVVVASVRLPVREWLPWYTRCADHLWIDVKNADGWHRIEWNSRLDHIAVDTIDEAHARSDRRWDEGTAVHEFATGARAKELGDRILAAAAAYPDAAHYHAWPGPNSNTFVEWLAREAGMAVVLPPNAIGKDYTPWLSAGISSSRTGVEIETMLVGAQVGLREGVELHLLGLTAGIGLWPPCLKLPLLPAIPGGWLGPDATQGR